MLTDNISVFSEGKFFLFLTIGGPDRIDVCGIILQELYPYDRMSSIQNKALALGQPWEQ